MKKFALIGAAGYIAPRHMKAIKDTGNILCAILDKSDSVGIIDQYFPDADYFSEFERFDRHLEKLRRKDYKIDYVSICSPNYLHDAHIRFALRSEANAICEKPLVLNPWNMEALKDVEKHYGKKIYTILQLRLHPNIVELKKRIDSVNDKKFDIDLTYITSRGHWYLYSWKGDESKSGGIATNIGIHFFDMLSWIFGRAQKNIVHIYERTKAAGFLELEKARVRWFLSIDNEDLPNDIRQKGQKTHRVIKIDENEFEFSTGFTELHTESYKKILAGEGFRIDDAAESLNIVYNIRNTKPIGLKGDYHPILAYL